MQSRHDDTRAGDFQSEVQARRPSRRRGANRGDDFQRATAGREAALRGLQHDLVLHGEQSASSAIVAVDLLRAAGERDEHVEGRDGRRGRERHGEAVEGEGVVEARGAAFRGRGDLAATAGAVPVFVDDFHARDLARGTRSGADSDLACELDRAASAQQSQLERSGLDLVGQDRVGQSYAAWDDFDHPLQQRLTRGGVRDWVRHGADGDIPIGAKHAVIRISPHRFRRPHRQRVLGLPGNEFRSDLLVELGRGIEVHDVVRGGARRHNLREVGGVHPAERVPASDHLDHLGRVEAHPSELVLEGVQRVLRQGHPDGPRLGRVDSPALEGDRWTAAGAYRCVEAQSDDVCHGRSAGEERRELRQGGGEGRAYKFDILLVSVSPPMSKSLACTRGLFFFRTYVITLIAAELEDDGRVQSTGSEKGVPGRHVVERGPDVLRGGDASGSF